MYYEQKREKKNWEPKNVFKRNSNWIFYCYCCNTPWKRVCSIRSFLKCIFVFIHPFKVIERNSFQMITWESLAWWTLLSVGQRSRSMLQTHDSNYNQTVNWDSLDFLIRNFNRWNMYGRDYFFFVNIKITCMMKIPITVTNTRL